MVEEIKSKSRYKTQKEGRKTEKVVQGSVVRKKKPFMRRAEDAMLSEDVSTVREYILWDVFIPAAKDTIVDMCKKALDAIFFGDRRTSSGYLERDRGATYVRYDKPSYERDRQYVPRNRRESRPSSRRALHNFDDIILDSRIDAENVLDAMVESTMQYGIVTVADFYEMVGIDPKYVDWNWGWYELSRARVERVRDGYIVVLPRPTIIDEEDR